MEIKIKFVGMDDWSREVFQDIETGRFYKRYEETDREFYSAAKFYGEPIALLKRDIIVTIVESQEEEE